ncbi:cytochrome P450 1A1-like [Acanthaster planci]|uniref:Cytochrome P450 1A1-like n=1 Tax=Acanthaster planci TaxID=133434 RepID=A0A8B7Z5T0_ACAPL|nr:cytochrome P450 1A1-like [Acanthaster planci]
MAVAEVITENVGLALMFIVTFVALLLYQNTRRPAGFPPGPLALPIIGNVLTFRSSEPVYQIFLQLAEQYGRVFSLKLGSLWVIVLNDVEDIREALIKQPIAFAGRPPLYSLSLLTEGLQDIVFSDYSEEWSLHRRLGRSALRHFAEGGNLEKLVHGVLPGVSKVLDQSAGKPIDLQDVFEKSIYIVLATMCYGKNYDFDDPSLAKWLGNNKEVKRLVGIGLPQDFIHCLRYLPTPVTAREKRMRRVMYEEVQYIYEEFKGHRSSFDPENIRDLFDSLIAAQRTDAAQGGSRVDFLTDTRIVQTIHDVFGAGVDTTIPALYWAVALVIEHPQILERVTGEIDTVIGPDCLPCLSHRGSMPYTEATLMEIFRYGATTPVGLPKSTTRDTTFRGFTIPKKTMVMVNHWAAHHSQNHWDEPAKFKPERFLDESETKLIKTPASFMPFGVGRRSCIGENFARGEIFILFCWLFGRYALSKVPGREEESLLRTKVSQELTEHDLCPYEVIVQKL